MTTNERSRGVVLLHVLVMVVLMAWIATLVLKALLSRQMTAARSTTSGENRATLAAAQAMVNSCLTQTGSSFAAVGTILTCSNISLPAGCLPNPMRIGAAGDPSSRLFNYCIRTSGTPPCKIVIKVCDFTATSCAAPSCP